MLERCRRAGGPNHEIILDHCKPSSRSKIPFASMFSSRRRLTSRSSAHDPAEARRGGPEVAAALEATARWLQVMGEVYGHLSLKEDARSVNILNKVVEKVFQSLAPSGPVARYFARISPCRKPVRSRSA